MKETTNKEQLINSISEDTGFTKKDTKIFIESFLTSVSNSLQSGIPVQLIGFGNFTVRDVAEKSGVTKLQVDEKGQPKAWTKEAHKAVGFKAGKGLKDIVNTIEEEF